MKTFYKVTVTCSHSEAFTHVSQFLLRDCFDRKNREYIINDYVSRVEKLCGDKAKVKIEKKKYKRVPNKYGVI
jgi:hypothetical protein